MQTAINRIEKQRIIKNQKVQLEKLRSGIKTRNTRSLIQLDKKGGIWGMLKDGRLPSKEEEEKEQDSLKKIQEVTEEVEIFIKDQDQLGTFSDITAFKKSSKSVHTRLKNVNTCHKRFSKFATDCVGDIAPWKINAGPKRTSINV